MSVVRAATWAGSGKIFALLNSGKSRVVNDAASIPTLTFAVGAQFVFDPVCSVEVIVDIDGCVKACVGADISSSSGVLRD